VRKSIGYLGMVWLAAQCTTQREGGKFRDGDILGR